MRRSAKYPFIWLKTILPTIAAICATITLTDPALGHVDDFIGLVACALAAVSALVADAYYWKCDSENIFDFYDGDTVPLGQEGRTGAGRNVIKQETI